MVGLFLYAYSGHLVCIITVKGVHLRLGYGMYVRGSEIMKIVLM